MVLEIVVLNWNGPETNQQTSSWIFLPGCWMDDKGCRKTPSLRGWNSTYWKMLSFLCVFFVFWKITSRHNANQQKAVWILSSTQALWWKSSEAWKHINLEKTWSNLKRLILDTTKLMNRPLMFLPRTLILLGRRKPGRFKKHSVNIW